MNLIDTHQHLFYREALRYPWLANVSQLDDDYPVERYLREAGEVHPTGTIFTECDVADSDIVTEAHFVYSLARKSPVPILGVIASGRPEMDGFEEHLESLDNPLLVGLRRVLHVAPDGTADSAAFVPNLKLLAERKLTFDLCVRDDQLALAQKLVQAVPELQFILDHCGCPKLDGSLDPAWSKAIRALAGEPNVACKVSGITTYGTRDQVTRDNLIRTMDAVLEAFGEDRLVWGSDWPVCTLNSSLSDWIEVTLSWASGLDPSTREKIFSKNASRIYVSSG